MIYDNVLARFAGSGDGCQDLVCVHLLSVGKIRITERAAQVAAAEPKEHSRRPRPETLALKAVEYLVNPVH